MAAQRVPKYKKLAARPNKDSTSGKEKIKVQRETATIPSKAKKKARKKSNEPLAKAQKALRAAQAEVRHERQARVQAEKTLTEVQEELAAARLEVEQKPQAQIRRVSFVVRLMVDEHGEPQRTEIEQVRTEIKQVESSRKQNFLGLDGERLVAFMKAYISPTIIPEDAIYTAPPPDQLTIPKAGPLRPKSSLIVSDVQVFPSGTPDLLTLILTPEEPFIVQAHFQLQGPDSDSLTTQEPTYEMKVYANEVTSGKSKLLTTYSARLIPNVLEYTAPAGVPGLSSGLYRLFTVVILSVPIEMAGFYGKTIIHVI